MRNFKLIFQYELSSLLGKKSTRITTLILALVALIGTSVPRIITWFDKPEDPAAVVETLPDSDMGYVFASPELHDAFAQALGVTEDNLYPDREALEAALNDRTLRAGAVITSDSQAEVLYLDRELESTDEQALSDILRQTHRNKFLEEKGITAAEMHAVETFAPQVSVTVLGQDSETNLMLAMILMIMVYTIVLAYGAITSTVIAREKDSKTMELLISSARPSSLILGKVAASGVSGVLQGAIIFLSAFIGFKLSESFYPPFVLLMLSGTLTPTYVTTYLFFSIAGYIMYLFLYASLGSTVSRVEDVSSAIGSVQFLFMLGYMIAVFTFNMPNSLVAVIGSIFPFTSMMVMPMRSAMVTIPPLQMIAAVVLLLASLVLLAYLSIKIYRWGTLNYGNKKGLINALKQMAKTRRRAA
jgi:ABC-2 type transport system permease protein